MLHENTEIYQKRIKFAHVDWYVSNIKQIYTLITHMSHGNTEKSHGHTVNVPKQIKKFTRVYWYAPKNIIMRYLIIDILHETTEMCQKKIKVARVTCKSIFDVM